jgi:hypothetical protein
MFAGIPEYYARGIPEKSPLKTPGRNCIELKSAAPKPTDYYVSFSYGILSAFS